MKIFMTLIMLSSLVSIAQADAPISQEEVSKAISQSKEISAVKKALIFQEHCTNEGLQINHLKNGNAEYVFNLRCDNNMNTDSVQTLVFKGKAWRVGESVAVSVKNIENSQWSDGIED